MIDIDNSRVVKPGDMVLVKRYADTLLVLATKVRPIGIILTFGHTLGEFSFVHKSVIHEDQQDRPTSAVAKQMKYFVGRKLYFRFGRGAFNPHQCVCNHAVVTPRWRVHGPLVFARITKTYTTTYINVLDT